MDNRIPKNYQGLLRFCTEQTANEDSTKPSEFGPLSDEKREFLQNVFNSLSENDPIKKMIEIVKKLNDDFHIHSEVRHTTANEVHENSKQTTSSDMTLEETTNQNLDENFVDKQESLIQQLIDYCEDIDLANDFHKIGGFSILLPLLSSKIPTFRSLTCELIAALTQNNPYGQQAILNENIVPHLVYLLSSQNNDCPQVKIKAMYALSCLSRFNEQLQEELLRLNFLPQIVDLINSDILKLQIKAAFLIGSLADENIKIKNCLRQIQSCTIISEALLKASSYELKEQLLYSIARIIKRNEDAILEDDLNLDKLVKNKFELLRFIQSEKAKLNENSSKAYKDNMDEVEALLKL